MKITSRDPNTSNEVILHVRFWFKRVSFIVCGGSFCLLLLLSCIGPLVHCLAGRIRRIWLIWIQNSRSPQSSVRNPEKKRQVKCRLTLWLTFLLLWASRPPSEAQQNAIAIDKKRPIKFLLHRIVRNPLFSLLLLLASPLIFYTKRSLFSFRTFSSVQRMLEYRL